MDRRTTERCGSRSLVGKNGFEVEVSSTSPISVYLIESSEEAENFRRMRRTMYVPGGSCDAQPMCCVRTAPSMLSLTSDKVYVGIICQNLILNCVVYDNSRATILAKPDEGLTLTIFTIGLFIGVPLFGIITIFACCCSLFKDCKREREESAAQIELHNPVQYPVGTVVTMQPYPQMVTTINQETAY